MDGGIFIEGFSKYNFLNQQPTTKIKHQTSNNQHPTSKIKKSIANLRLFF
jgi:hypothetical protein